VILLPPIAAWIALVVTRELRSGYAPMRSAAE
jgi:hypothetical protein